MATRKQTQAAKRNVKTAQKAAADRKTIAHLPADTKSAGQTGRGRSPAQASGRHFAQDSGRTLRDRTEARASGQVENGPGRTSPEARRELTAMAWFHG
jgi:hypothetical protein